MHAQHRSCTLWRMSRLAHLERGLSLDERLPMHSARRRCQHARTLRGRCVDRGSRRGCRRRISSSPMLALVVLPGCLCCGGLRAGRGRCPEVLLRLEPLHPRVQHHLACAAPRPVLRGQPGPVLTGSTRAPPYEARLAGRRQSTRRPPTSAARGPGAARVPSRWVACGWGRRQAGRCSRRPCCCPRWERAPAWPQHLASNSAAPSFVCTTCM